MFVRRRPFQSEMYVHDNNSGETNSTAIILLSNVSAADPGLDGEVAGAWDGENAEFNAVWRTGDTHNTARGICLVIFVALGAALNTFMIVAIAPNRRLRTVRNILLIHLGCTGLMLSFLVNLVTAVVSFTGKWFGGMALCQVYGFTMSVLTLVTAWTIAALSWDKYQTIASPLHHSFTAIAVKMVVCFTIFWTLACTFSLPPLLGGSRFVFHPVKGICFVCTRTILSKVYVVAYILLAFYIPLGVMLYCYTHIFRIARTQSSRIAATMIRMTCVIQAPVTSSGQTNGLSIQGTKAMCTILQLIGAFVVTYVPFSVILLLEISSDKFHLNGVVTSSFTMLFLTSPVVNAAVYGLRNKILRASFYRYMRRKIRYYCYKDKRRGSVKSYKSSSFKATMLNRRNQNGDTPGLRRTQSFPVRGTKGRLNRSPTNLKTNGCLVPRGPVTIMTRPHSFNVLNGSPRLQPTEEEEEEEEEEENGIVLKTVELDDIPHIDDD